MLKLQMHQYCVQKSKNFVLLSGGIDSAVLLAHQVALGENPEGIFFNYSQRAAHIELKSSELICEKYSVPLHKLSLEELGSTFQKINKLHIPLPDRNLILLSIAMSYTITNGGNSISIGVNESDLNKNYSTATLEFLDVFKTLANNLHPGFIVKTPLINFTKTQVLERGEELGVDFAHCFSCMRISHKPHEFFEHCGTCQQCKERKQAFKDVHMNDYTIYKK